MSKKLVIARDITIIRRCFYLNGFDIYASDKDPIIKRPFLFYSPLIGIAFYSYALFNFTLTYYRKVDKLVSAMAVIVQLYLCVIKIFIFAARNRRFLGLIKSLEELAERGNDEERDIWNKETVKMKAISIFFAFTCVSTAAIAFFAPLVRLLVIYKKSGEIDIMLPLPGIFPYDNNKPYFLILTNIFYLQLIYQCLNSIIAVDSLFGWYVYNISAHFSILRLKIERIITTFHSRPYRVFQLDFAALIEYHRKVINMTLEFDDVFAQIMLCEVLFSCLQICFLAYQIVFSQDPTSLPFVCALMCSIMLQLIIYCFGGERVKTEHDETCDQIYMLTPWHALPSRVQRQFLLPLIRTQRVMTLKGYFFTADRNLLVWIFRTAGSFITLLSALNEK